MLGYMNKEAYLVTKKPKQLFFTAEVKIDCGKKAKYLEMSYL